MKTKRNSPLPILAAAVAGCCFSIGAQAAVILQPSALGAGSIAGGAYTAARAGDKSGLSGSYTSGVSDFSTTLSTLTHAQDAANTTWASALSPALNVAPLSGNAYLTIDMGATVGVSRIGIWVGLDGDVPADAFNFASTNQFEVFSATDETFTSLTSLGVFNLPDNSPGTGIAFDITDTTSRYFLLNVLSLYPTGNAHASFGEVAFEAVPEPSAALLGSLGGLLLLRRRK